MNLNEYELNLKIKNFQENLYKFEETKKAKIKEVEEGKVLGIKELQEKLDKKNSLVKDNSFNSENQVAQVAYAYFLSQFIYFLVLGFGALIFLK
jgi:hypothetical protein